MTKEREALKRALEALKYASSQIAKIDFDFEPEITAIKEVLAQPEQEPVAECVDDGEGGVYYRTIKRHIGLLYTTPPQRTWIGLTDEETDHIIRQPHGGADPQEWVKNLASALEAKLKEKNA